MNDDEFVQGSAERRAAAIAAAHDAAARFDGVEVRELPGDAPLSPSAALWSVRDAQHLVTISANATATSLMRGDNELVCLDDTSPLYPERTLVPAAGLADLLALAVELAQRGVPCGREQSEDVLLRPEQPEDVAKIAAVHRAAFTGSDEAELVAALRSSDAWVPELSFVARTDDAQIVGHVVLTASTVGHTPVLALAPVGVVPNRQGQGIGERLVADALLHAAALGYAAAVVLGDPAYYGRFGFSPARAQGITPPEEAWPDEAFQARSLNGAPVPQGVMTYAAPFGL